MECTVSVPRTKWMAWRLGVERCMDSLKYSVVVLLMIA